MKTKEEILQKVWLEQGSHVVMSQDKTAWKGLALLAMEEYAQQFKNNNTSAYELFEEWIGHEVIERYEELKTVINGKQL